MSDTMSVDTQKIGETIGKKYAARYERPTRGTINASKSNYEVEEIINEAITYSTNTLGINPFDKDTLDEIVNWALWTYADAVSLWFQTYVAGIYNTSDRVKGKKLGKTTPYLFMLYTR